MNKLCELVHLILVLKNPVELTQVYDSFLLSSVRFCVHGTDGFERFVVRADCLERICCEDLPDWNILIFFEDFNILM